MEEMLENFVGTFCWLLRTVVVDHFLQQWTRKCIFLNIFEWSFSNLTVVMSIETISSFTDTAATTEFFGDLLGAFISQNKASA